MRCKLSRIVTIWFTLCKKNTEARFTWHSMRSSIAACALSALEKVKLWLQNVLKSVNVKIVDVQDRKKTCCGLLMEWMEPSWTRSQFGKGEFVGDGDQWPRSKVSDNNGGQIGVPHCWILLDENTKNGCQQKTTWQKISLLNQCRPKHRDATWNNINFWISVNENMEFPFVCSTSNNLMLSLVNLHKPVVVSNCRVLDTVIFETTHLLKSTWILSCFCCVLQSVLQFAVVADCAVFPFLVHQLLWFEFISSHAQLVMG